MNWLTRLINLLRDKTARIDERDDAAIDLGTSDDPKALDALLEVACDPTENEMIVGSSGESIADIVVRNGRFDLTWLDGFAPAAKRELRARLAAERPDLLGDVKE
jgi:hypothetical protein